MRVQNQPPKNRKSDAYILDIDDRFIVRPSVAVLKRNDEFEIYNLCGQDAVVTFPDFPGQTLSLHHGEWGTAMVGGQGVYRYEVKVGGRRAHAESDPVIIIDPAP